MKKNSKLEAFLIFLILGLITYVLFFLITEALLKVNFEQYSPVLSFLGGFLTVLFLKLRALLGIIFISSIYITPAIVARLRNASHFNTQTISIISGLLPIVAIGAFIIGSFQGLAIWLLIASIIWIILLFWSMLAKKYDNPITEEIANDK